MAISYTRHYRSMIGWKNAPDTSTPIDENNLGKTDSALKYHDDILADLVAMVSQYETDINRISSELSNIRSELSSKADKSTVNNTINRITYDDTNSVFKFYTVANTLAKSVDLYLEDLPVRFWFENNRLYMEDTKGTRSYVNLSDLIKTYNFIDTDEIIFEVNGYNVKASIKNGSITDEKIEAGYLSKLTEQAEIGMEAAELVEQRNQEANEALDRVEEDMADTDKMLKKAKLYLNFVVPDFIIDGNILYMKSTAEKIFMLQDNKLYLKIE